MAYSTLSDTQIDGDSPLIADTFFKLRDNPIAIANGDSGAPKIQDAALDTGAATTAGQTWVGLRIPAASITQGRLNSSTGEVSTSSATGSNELLPGGEYGFFPRIRVSNAVYDGSATICVDSSATTYGSRINLAVTSGGTIYALQRYINSSPPYDLGDGDVPLFVFALVNSAGEVESTYAADVPPWAYNGPTRVTADRIAADGRKFQNRRFIDPATGDLIRDEIEITHELKNADMELIPHPFGGNDLAGKTIVLLDPVETLDLLDLHEMGESIADMLYGRHLVVDSDRIKRAAPAGVQPSAVKWKQAQKRWRAVPSVISRMEKAPVQK